MQHGQTMKILCKVVERVSHKTEYYGITLIWGQ